MKILVRLTAIALLGGIVGCAAWLSQSVNANYNPAKSHHTPDGFKNNYPHATGESFWKWQWERLREGTPSPPSDGWASVLPSVKPDVAFLKANRGSSAERTMTWIGHATVLLQTSGVNVLTDPVFSERTSPVQFAGPKRQVPLMMTVDELPDIDVVFISHNHYDHLDVSSVKALSQRFPKAVWIVPLGLKPWFEQFNVPDVRQLDWWDNIDLHGLKFTFVPVQHWSKRSLSDTNRSLWGGIVVEDAKGSTGSAPTVGTRPWRFLHTGDTGYSQDFKDIGARFPGGIDWLAVPIGAYEPRWFMKTQHVNPDESVQIMRDVGAKHALGIHWGTFILTDEPLDQPPKDLAVALAKYGVDAAKFHVFKNGETRRLGR
jgi:N-acyl-phosphatidylethanolamine-hydrolysing phospholipase D